MVLDVSPALNLPLPGSSDPEAYGKPFTYGHIFTPSNQIKGCLSATVVICLVTAVAFMLIMSFAGHLSNNLYQDLARFFHTIDPTRLAIGVSITGVLIGGAIFVIHHVKHKVDPLIQSNFANLPKKEDILEVGYTFDYYDEDIGKNREGHRYGYIDTTTLVNGKGKAYVYATKYCNDHYSVSAVVTVASPLYAVAAIVYDTIRLCVIPFYILGCWLIERCRKDPLFEKEGQRIPERKFKIKDIGKEIGMSLFRLVKAPFYGTAYFFAAYYTLLNPAAGRTLAAAIERDWNEDISRAEGFWSVDLGQKLWDGCEGGGGPNGLGRNGFYLAGCWQPIGVIEFYEDENGEIKVRGCSLAEFIKKGSGHTFKAIFTGKDILLRPAARSA